MSKEKNWIGDIALWTVLAVVIPLIILDLIKQNLFKKTMKPCIKCSQNSCFVVKK